MVGIPITASRNSTRLAVLGACLLAVLSGCGGDDPVKPNPQPRYLSSSTPQNVLENLKRAYTSRDSTGYDSLFDAAYVGTSVDQSDPAPSVLTFTKADESTHIRALAHSSSIVGIDFRYPSVLVRETDVGDSLGWATIQIPSYSFVLDLIDVPSYFHVDQAVSMEFKFRPISPAPGSPTDTTWKIVRWSELKL